MRQPLSGGFAALVLLAACGGSAPDGDGTIRHVSARVQTRLGGPLEDTQMAVRQVPVNPEKVPAEQAALDDGELVLGLVADGQPVAYPIRYLALYEVINDSVGTASLAPTW